MKVALGMKAHSGWAALVVVGKNDGDYVVVDRTRLELVDEEWAKQPYHAAEELSPAAARDLVTRGVESAHRIATRELRAAMERETERENDVLGCGVLVADPMPAWTVEEILAVHFRMHKAEGVLFRNALVHGAGECGVRLFTIHEKALTGDAEKELGVSLGSLAKKISAMGKTVGAPWGKDQKDAALAALIALQDA